MFDRKLFLFKDLFNELFNDWINKLLFDFFGKKGKLFFISEFNNENKISSVKISENFPLLEIVNLDYLFDPIWVYIIWVDGVGVMV